MLFCFTNTSSKILLNISGYSFWHQAWSILPNAIAVKCIKNYLRKSCSSLVPKMLVTLTPAQVECIINL
jgi:hypothetical protein